MRPRLLAPLLLLAALPFPASAHTPMARVDPGLLAAAGPVTVFVHGTNAAEAAAEAGLHITEQYRQIGIVVATGPASAVRKVVKTKGIAYVEDASTPITFNLDHANQSTRNPEAQAAVSTTTGRLSGRGVSVAVIDTGIDGTHPFFTQEGKSKVVANLKYGCTDLATSVWPDAPGTCWAPVLTNDSDTVSAGGHGTHVAGIAAGYPTQVTSQLYGESRKLAGAAPGASLVALSVGTGLSINGGTSGLNWVLDHHRNPCSANACPPIRVVNNSWGPIGGSAFNPGSAVVKLQRALVAAGVVVVWAAGNDDGDGSGKDTATHTQSQLTNGPGNDPTPGVLMVAAYDDDGTGSRDGTVASYSSRGTKGKPDTYPDLSAPGSRITSSCRPTLAVCSQGLESWDGPGLADQGAYNTISGTSMAAPYVSGVVAELLQVQPSATPAQVELALENGAHRFGQGYEPDPANPSSPTSFDKGHGLVDVPAAISRLRSTPPAATSVTSTNLAPKRVRDCAGTAWTDVAGDATTAHDLVNTGVNHPNADLRAGRWEWDGRVLTAVFLVQDLSKEAYSTGESGTYVNWRVSIGNSTDIVTIVGGAGNGASYYMSRSGSPGITVSLTGTWVDQPGKGADEIRVSVSNDELAMLSSGLAVLAPGLHIATDYAKGGYHPAPGTFVGADTAEGPCSVVLL